LAFIENSLDEAESVPVGAVKLARWIAHRFAAKFAGRARKQRSRPKLIVAQTGTLAVPLAI
jgi:hypothetical protein